MEVGSQHLNDRRQVGVVRVCLRHGDPVGEVRHLMIIVTKVISVMMMTIKRMTSFKSGNLGTKSLATQGEWRNLLR